MGFIETNKIFFAGKGKNIVLYTWIILLLSLSVSLFSFNSHLVSFLFFCHSSVISPLPLSLLKVSINIWLKFSHMKSDKYDNSFTALSLREGAEAFICSESFKVESMLAWLLVSQISIKSSDCVHCLSIFGFVTLAACSKCWLPQSESSPWCLRFLSS